MKNVFLTMMFMIGFITFSMANPKPSSKSINVKQSMVNWTGYKVLGNHTGSVKFVSGSLEFNDANVLTGGMLTVDMNSINCTDLQAGQGKEKLEGHLKSDDFFGTNKYPNATIKIKKVISRGKAGEYKVVADLTIKNITKEIKFDASVMNNKATANLKIDRSDFDIRYGSGSFFDNLGDNTIYDEFDLSVNIVL